MTKISLYNDNNINKGLLFLLRLILTDPYGMRVLHPTCFCIRTVTIRSRTGFDGGGQQC